MDLKDMFPSAHVQVRSASAGSEAGSRLMERLASLNFPTQVHLVTPTPAQFPVPDFSCYKIETELKSLLDPKFLALLKEAGLLEGMSVVSESAVQHENSFSVHSGTLYCTLAAESYYKLGLKGVQSGAYVQKRRAKMFRLHFTLSGFTDTEVPHDHLKFLWFTERVYDQKISIVLSIPSGGVEIVEQNFPQAVAASVVQTSFTLGNIVRPPLAPSRDEAWAQQVLEWITYITIGGRQLYAPEDPYLSTYPVSSFEPEDPLVTCTVHTVSGVVFPSDFASNLASGFNAEWSAIVVHGVRDVNTAFRSTEHVVYENGENAMVLLRSKDSLVLWEVVSGGESH